MSQDTFKVLEPPEKIIRSFNEAMSLEKSLMDIVGEDFYGDSMMYGHCDGVISLDPDDNDKPMDHCSVLNSVSELFHTIGRMYLNTKYNEFYYLRHGNVLFIFNCGHYSMNDRIEKMKSEVRTWFANEMIKNHTTKGK